MSCGNRFNGFINSRFEREDLAAELWDNNEINHAQYKKIVNGECFDEYETRKIKTGLESLGKTKNIDFRIEDCSCDT